LLSALVARASFETRHPFDKLRRALLKMKLCFGFGHRPIHKRHPEARASGDSKDEW